MRTTIILIITALLIGGLVYFLKAIPNLLGGQPISSSQALGTNSSVSVTSTVRLVLAEATNAQFRSISNVGAADVWLSATTTSLSANNGFWLKASTTQVFTGDSLYVGNIYGTSTTAGTTLSILQL